MTVTASDRDSSGAITSEPYVIVSCDTHIGPRLEQELRPYCPTELLDDCLLYTSRVALWRSGRELHRCGFAAYSIAAD